MTTADALRHLLTVLHAMDLENQQLRPTEEQYQAAVAQAEVALKVHDDGRCVCCGRGPHPIDDPECKPLQLRDGTKVELSSRWTLPE